MFKLFTRLWNYFYGKCRRPFSTRDVDLKEVDPREVDSDRVARGLVELVFPPKWEAEDNDDLFIEELDREHFENLSREADPLEVITEIPDDSVIKSKAGISPKGTVSQRLSPTRATGSDSIVRSDRVKTGRRWCSPISFDTKEE